MTDQTGIEPPRDPVAAPQLVFPLTVPTPPPSRGPLIALVVGLFIVAVVIVTVGAFVLSSAVARAIDSSDLGAAARVVSELDAAFADADCDAFEDSTSESARDEILGASYDCEAFEAAADALTEDGDYVYSVTITDSHKRGDLITVSTDEAYGDEKPREYSYVLEREGDQWVVTAYGED